ncbi:MULTISPECIES: hypothetical protein [Halobaculum]|uniref:Uncharacterized protein n=2 Tax=Halobaculum TaxID=43927 RepID=A0A8T8WDK6_9EURY|nr:MULTISPECIES: hypothetical protein [Halobaculum]QZP37920.1 hypothetical protein K6T50_01730 [Halobaculum magnesiiphilum]QZY02909.1 hypothetical protein K6T36_01545 [Halobaculum roseum]
MVTVAEGVTLAGAALGAVGGALVALEFFQVPSYVTYEEEWDSYDVDIAPAEVTEHTNLGRVGGLLVSLGFTLLFVGELL